MWCVRTSEHPFPAAIQEARFPALRALCALAALAFPVPLVASCLALSHFGQLTGWLSHRLSVAVVAVTTCHLVVVAAAAAAVPVAVEGKRAVTEGSQVACKAFVWKALAPPLSSSFGR